MELDIFPSDIVKQYNLKELVCKYGYVYMEVIKGMYGLPQTGLLAQKLLGTMLQKHGYTQSKVTPSLWTHEWHPICFTLIVDNFGVKYMGKEHVDLP